MKAPDVPSRRTETLKTSSFRALDQLYTLHLGCNTVDENHKAATRLLAFTDVGALRALITSASSAIKTFVECEAYVHLLFDQVVLQSGWRSASNAPAAWSKIAEGAQALTDIAAVAHVAWDVENAAQELHAALRKFCNSVNNATIFPLEMREVLELNVIVGEFLKHEMVVRMTQTTIASCLQDILHTLDPHSRSGASPSSLPPPHSSILTASQARINGPENPEVAGDGSKAVVEGTSRSAEQPVVVPLGGTTPTTSPRTGEAVDSPVHALRKQMVGDAAGAEGAESRVANGGQGAGGRRRGGPHMRGKRGERTYRDAETEFQPQLQAAAPPQAVVGEQPMTQTATSTAMQPQPPTLPPTQSSSSLAATPKAAEVIGMDRQQQQQPPPQQPSPRFSPAKDAPPPVMGSAELTSQEPAPSPVAEPPASQEQEQQQQQQQQRRHSSNVGTVMASRAPHLLPATAGPPDVARQGLASPVNTYAPSTTFYNRGRRGGYRGRWGGGGQRRHTWHRATEERAVQTTVSGPLTTMVDQGVQTEEHMPEHRPPPRGRGWRRGGRWRANRHDREVRGAERSWFDNNKTAPDAAQSPATGRPGFSESSAQSAQGPPGSPLKYKQQRESKVQGKSGERKLVDEQVRQSGQKADSPSRRTAELSPPNHPHQHVRST